MRPLWDLNPYCKGLSKILIIIWLTSNLNRSVCQNDLMKYHSYSIFALSLYLRMYLIYLLSAVLQIVSLQSAAFPSTGCSDPFYILILCYSVQSKYVNIEQQTSFTLTLGSWSRKINSVKFAHGWRQATFQRFARWE